MSDETGAASPGSPRRAVGWTPRLVSFVLVAVSISGCSVAVPFVSKTPQELAVAALSALAKKPVMHVTGTLTAEKAYQVDVTGSEGGTAKGSGTYEDRPFSYLAAGGKQYLKGATFWEGLYSDAAHQRQARGYQDNWVVAGDTAVASVLGQVVSPYTLVPTLGPHVKQLKRDGTTTVAGRSAVALRDGQMTYYITDSDPIRLVRVESASGYVEPSGLGQLKLEIGYPSSGPSVQAPQAAIDPADPKTLPALYVAVNETDDTPCDQSSCLFKITLRNEAGKSVGQTVVTLHILSDPDRKEIGSCQAPVPSADFGQDVTATCTVTGQPWTSYIKAGHKSYIATYDYKNPPYDP
jgi:hypothetical protein